jgi:hypothetical protein
MKCTGFAIVLVVLAAGHELVSAARLGETPMAKVVTLLQNMEKKIEATGKSEQESYDKYACWCEDTLAEKAEDITKAKDKIEELQNNINKNKGGLGSGGATIAQLNKDIGENLESQKEATEVRKKENTEYAEERGESEQCIGALEAAIKVLEGSGTGKKKGFLETMQEAQVLSVVAGVRPVLKARVLKHSMKQSDLEVVQHFVEKPEDFVKGKSAFVQHGQNPFGDYAPQSTQIQGILKSMYDTFTGDLEKDNAEEADKQKAFEELMATKKKELKTLESSLEDETGGFAERTKSVADDKAMRDDTKEQLASDEDFFTSTKAACQKKATFWATRSRLRTQELSGIGEAIKILNSDEAKKNFEESQKFLQLSSAVHHKGDGTTRAGAYKRLRSLASGYHSLKLAQIAVAVKTTGHFDDVIVMIDKMITTLRQEEQEDIDHRDRCEGKQNANKNSKEDSEHEIKKAEDEIKRLEDAIKDKKADVKEIEESMKKTKKTQDEITKKRKEETEDFKKAQKADAEAIETLDKALLALQKFYRDTKASALQVDGKKQPETNFQDDDYKGSTGEARGVIGIIEMLKEDITKEMKSQGQDEIDAQTEYEEDMTALTRKYRASEAAKTKTEGEIADLSSDKQDQSEKKGAAQDDLDNEKKLAEAIKKDCDWVEDHFDKRREARKAEIAGLNDAKDFLAGAGSDSDLEMP